MSDIGSEYADERIRAIERKLNKIYSEASKDLEEKIRLFTKKYETKEKIHLKELKDEKITQDDFDAWKRGQVFQGEQWEAKRKQVLHTLTQTNEMASQIVNGEAVKVFTMNGNFAAYDLEKTGGVNFGFPLYDATSVVNIVKQEDPYLLPQWKINEPKDYVWNSKKVGNQITQGIIQGEKLDQIAKRLAKNLCMQNKNSSLTFARTAMTGAQNGGRSLRYRQAEKLGINMHQEWMATLDGRTRHSHRSMDGEKIPVGRDFKFSNECRYPGDPEGPPWEVYNCRCTLVADLDDYPAEYERYDNIDGKPIKNMTYKEWYKTKSMQKYNTKQGITWDENYAGIHGRQYGVPDTSDALLELQHGIPNSLENWLDENGNLLPEREALHKQIIDSYLKDKTPEKGTATMIMMGGGPASGKSSVIKSGLYKLPDEKRSITIDPDNVKKRLPGYEELAKKYDTAASFYHEESSMLAKRLASTCFSENYDVVYDGTGDGSVGSVMKKINGARENGYRVNGMYVTVDIDEAIKRNQSRYEHAVAKGEAPRKVPPSYVTQCHQKVTQISMEVGDQFDNISLYDNNGTSSEIKLIAEGGNGIKLTAIRGEEEAFQRFLDKVK